MFLNMNFKKSLLFLGISISGVILSACGDKAPNLSFEETLKVYNASSESIHQIVNLITAQEGIYQSDFNGSITINKEKSVNGKALINLKQVSDKKTKDTDSTMDVNLEVNNTDEELGLTGNISAKLGIKAIVKDFITYLQLSELEIKGNEAVQSQLAMPLAMVEGFKKKWFSIDMSELKETLESSNKYLPTINREISKNKPEHFTGVISTTYEGQPAWKVDFNTEIIKQDWKKLIDETMMNFGSGLNLTGEELKTYLEEQEKIRDDMYAIIDWLQWENIDAYFVIYSADNVKFVIKNIDIKIPDPEEKENPSILLINLKQETTKSTSQGTFTLSSTEQEKKATFTYSIKQANKGSYTFNGDINIPDSPLLSFDGKLNLELSNKGFAIKPDLNIKIDTTTTNIQGTIAHNQLSSYTFNAPSDAESLDQLLWGMFGGATGSSETWEDTEYNTLYNTPEVLTGM